eukprot:594123-Pleurochrysis_carterae.AAC.1
MTGCVRLCGGGTGGGGAPCGCDSGALSGVDGSSGSDSGTPSRFGLCRIKGIAERIGRIVVTALRVTRVSRVARG